MDRGALWATIHRVTQSRMTEAIYHACMPKMPENHLEARGEAQNKFLFTTPEGNQPVYVLISDFWSPKL